MTGNAAVTRVVTSVAKTGVMWTTAVELQTAAVNMQRTAVELRTAAVNVMMESLEESRSSEEEASDVGERSGSAELLDNGGRGDVIKSMMTRIAIRARNLLSHARTALTSGVVSIASTAQHMVQRSISIATW